MLQDGHVLQDCKNLKRAMSNLRHQSNDHVATGSLTMREVLQDNIDEEFEGYESELPNFNGQTRTEAMMTPDL